MTETVREIRAVELDPKEGLRAYSDLQEMYAYWEQLRKGAIAPLKDDIDPMDFTHVLPRVMLSDVVQDGGMLAFRYRLSGTGICDVHGFEPTGLTTRGLSPPEYAELITAHYTQCVTEMRPLAHIIILHTNEKVRSYARLLLPLISEDGEVSTLMSIDSKKQNSLREFLEEIEALGQIGALPV